MTVSRALAGNVLRTRFVFGDLLGDRKSNYGAIREVYSLSGTRK